jgi:hypothetical protein
MCNLHAEDLPSQALAAYRLGFLSHSFRIWVALAAQTLHLDDNPPEVCRKLAQMEDAVVALGASIPICWYQELRQVLKETGQDWDHAIQMVNQYHCLQDEWRDRLLTQACAEKWPRVAQLLDLALRDLPSALCWYQLGKALGECLWENYHDGADAAYQSVGAIIQSARRFAPEVVTAFPIIGALQQPEIRLPEQEPVEFFDNVAAAMGWADWYDDACITGDIAVIFLFQIDEMLQKLLGQSVSSGPRIVPTEPAGSYQIQAVNDLEVTENSCLFGSENTPATVLETGALTPRVEPCFSESNGRQAPAATNADSHPPPHTRSR